MRYCTVFTRGIGLRGRAFAVTESTEINKPFATKRVYVALHNIGLENPCQYTRCTLKSTNGNWYCRRIKATKKKKKHTMLNT